MSRAGSFVRSLGIVTAAIASALLLGEAAVRLSGIEGRVKMRVVPGKGLTFEPGASYRHVKEGFSSGRFNAQGFRDRERTVAKPAGGFRILVLGDSFVEALQVPLDAAFPAVLEDRLRARPGGGATEVLAMGQSGFGTASELMRYLDFGAAYSPDVVLLAFYAGNDVRDNSRRLNRDLPGFYFTLGADGDLVLDRSLIDHVEKSRASAGFTDRVRDWSQLAAFVSERTFLLRQARREAARRTGPLDNDESVYAEEAGPVWREAWDVTEAILDRFVRETAARGSRFALVSIGTSEQVEEDLGRAVLARGPGRDLDRPDRRLQATAARLGIPGLLLAPGLRAAEASGSGYLYGFGAVRRGHWNAAGHRVAAGLIERFLDEQGLASPPPPPGVAASSGPPADPRAFTAPSSRR
jgi:hypothetical protein